MFMYHVHAWYPQKRVSDPLELELWMAVSPDVRTENPTRVLCRNDELFESPSISPVLRVLSFEKISCIGVTGSPCSVCLAF